MKKIGIFLISLILLVASPLSVYADDKDADYNDSLERVIDNANLLTSSEEEKLADMIEDIKDKYKFDVVILLEPDIDGAYCVSYADDYFDYKGYGYGKNYDGILLLVTMEEREWAISTCGYGIEAFTDYGCSYIEDKIVSKLSDGDYYEACETYVKLCDKFLKQAEKGKPYDYNHPIRSPFFVIGMFAVIWVVAFLIAYGIVASMKRQMSTVAKATEANSYAVGKAVNLTRNEDRYIRSAVTKRPRPTDSGGSGGHSGGSSTHHSSSGRSHGGSHGRF